MEYKIVDKPEMPNHYGRKLFWKPLVDNLPFNKAIQFEFTTRREAKNKAMSMGGSLRTTKVELGYKPHTHIIPNGEKFILYVWKEPINY